MPVIDAGSDNVPAGAQAVATQAAGPPETSAMSIPNMAEMMSDLTPDNCGAKIAELKRKALDMKKERREVAKQLKSAQKKNNAVSKRRPANSRTRIYFR